LFGVPLDPPQIQIVVRG